MPGADPRNADLYERALSHLGSVMLRELTVRVLTTTITTPAAPPAAVSPARSLLEDSSAPSCNA
jgi:hypothetical protein